MVLGEIRYIYPNNLYVFFLSLQMMKSLEVGYWVDEEPYELSDAFPAAQVITGARPFLKKMFCFKISQYNVGLLAIYLLALPP